MRTADVQMFDRMLCLRWLLQVTYRLHIKTYQHPLGQSFVVPLVCDFDLSRRVLLAKGEDIRDISGTPLASYSRRQGT